MKKAISLDQLEMIAGGDLTEESEALKNTVPPHVHQVFPAGRDDNGVRIDKCAICGTLKYYATDGEEITEWEYKLRHSI